MLSLFAGRLIQVQGFESGTYRQLAAHQRDRPIALPAVRGSITGANGEMLAMTVTTYLVYADPLEIPVGQQQQVANSLAGPLDMTPIAILALIQHPTSQQYVVLAKGVTAQVSDQITALNLPGINLTPTYARSYPDGEATANIIGFTGTNKGILIGGAGLEEQYNTLLASRPAASRSRPARTASRSRSRAATTSRW